MSNTQVFTTSGQKLQVVTGDIVLLPDTNNVSSFVATLELVPTCTSVTLKPVLAQTINGSVGSHIFTKSVTLTNQFILLTQSGGNWTYVYHDEPFIDVGPDSPLGVSTSLSPGTTSGNVLTWNGTSWGDAALPQSSVAKTAGSLSATVPGPMVSSTGLLQPLPYDQTYTVGSNFITYILGAGFQPIHSHIITGSDGRLWLANGAAHAFNIDGSSPTAYGFTNSGNWTGNDVCNGPDGNIWITMSSNLAGAGNALVAVFSTAGTAIAQYTTNNTSTGFGANGNLGICAGPDGRIWFCEFSSDSIGAINTDGTGYTEYVLTSGAHPVSICAGSDGRIWFTENGLGKIGVLKTNGTGYQEFTAVTGVHDVCASADGSIAFASGFTSPCFVGSMSTSGTINWTKQLTNTASAKGPIISGPDGRIWFVEANLGKIAYINTNGTGYTELSAGTGNIQGLGVTPDGNIIYSWGSNTGEMQVIPLIKNSGHVAAQYNSYYGPVTTIAGSSGNYYWSMPEQGSSYKKLVIALSAYTNGSTSAITFPTAFVHTPGVTGNSTSLTISTISTSSVTLPTASSITGTIVIEGI